MGLHELVHATTWNCTSDYCPVANSIQIQRYFTPHKQAELEQAFIYIIHKPIDFSIDFSHIDLKILGHMVIGLKQVRVPIGT